MTNPTDRERVLRDAINDVSIIEDILASAELFGAADAVGEAKIRLTRMHADYSREEDASRFLSEAPAAHPVRETGSLPPDGGPVQSPIGWYVSEDDAWKFDRLLTDPTTGRREL